MFFGATSPARSSGPRLVDLNLVPAEFRPKPFPVLSIGLAVLAVGCALLLYAAYYAKTYTELEVGQLTSRVNQAETLVKAATGDPAALARTDQLRAMRNDFSVLAQREISWGDVFQTIGEAPPGVVVSTISQAGFGVTVTGSASNSAAAALYVNKLRASKLFVDAALQLNPAAATLTPTETPTPPQPPSPVAPAPAVQPAQSVAPIRTLAPRPTAPVAPPPAAPTAVPTKMPIPTITTTPSITPTSTPTTTPTSAFDFALLSKQQIPASNPMAGSSDIKGTVVDLDDKPIGGLTIEIESEGSPPWSSTLTTDATYGSFDFSVTHGKFKVYVVGGRSQPAIDLYTGADGVAGTYGYQLSFQATFTGAPPPEIVGTATGTLTPTSSTTPSDTPIALGQNIASWGCANAYLQSSPSSHLGNDANLAIDGNFGTEWNAAMAPSNGVQVIWQWSLPSGPTKCNDGRTAAGLPDDQDHIEGFQLIPDQNPAGATTHELWLYADAACTSNLHPDNSAYFIWSGGTSAGQILPLHISPAAMVRCIIVRTIADPSFVAWEEIQIYQAVPPPQGFPSLTATPTGAPTASPTQTGTPPTATSTLTSTSTPQSPTPTFTSLPVTGKNVASSGSMEVTGSNGVVLSGITCATPTGRRISTDPCAAIDEDPTTYWAPLPGAVDAQILGVNLVETSSAPIYDVRVTIQSTGRSSNGESYSVQINGVTAACTPSPQPSIWVDYAQLECPVAIPTPSGSPWSQGFSANVIMFQSVPNGVEDGNFGIRELAVYAQPNVTPVTVTPSSTPTITNTPTVTPTPTPSLTVHHSAPARNATPSLPAKIGSVKTVTATVTPTRSASPGVAGLGRGPGDTTVFAPNSQASNDAQAVDVPSPTPDGGTLVAQTGGPVDFTIVLEVASGAGYR